MMITRFWLYFCVVAGLTISIGEGIRDGGDPLAPMLFVTLAAACMGIAEIHKSVEDNRK